MILVAESLEEEVDELFELMDTDSEFGGQTPALGSNADSNNSIGAIHVNAEGDGAFDFDESAQYVLCAHDERICIDPPCAVIRSDLFCACDAWRRADVNRHNLGGGVPHLLP